MSPMIAAILAQFEKPDMSKVEFGLGDHVRMKGGVGIWMIVDVYPTSQCYAVDYGPSKQRPHLLPQGELVLVKRARA